MKNKGIIIIIVLIILGLVVPFSYLFYSTKGWNDLIYPGVSIEGVNVGGKSKEEALKIIKSQFGDEILKKKITIKTPSNNYSITFDKLNAKYNTAETVKKAFEYGKDLNILSRYKAIKTPNKKELKLEFTCDKKPVTELINKIEKDVNKNPVNATITKVGGSSFEVSSDKKGAALEKDKLIKDVDKLINGEVGTDINIEAPIKEVTAKITKDKLSTINAKISSSTTSFSSSSSNRCYNIELASKAINGTVLLPGDTFSFNGVVGERTVSKGYKEAGVIIGNKVDSGIGGGICQVSTTLYNAILRSNIKSVERTHHSLPSSYVDLGMDATVDYGNLDYKFKNTLEYPIYIEAVTVNKTITFNVYSNSSLATKRYELYNEVYKNIEPSISYINDPSLPEGTTEYVQKPSTGHRVKVYKRIYENDKLIGQELVSDDYYKPINGVIKRGTKKVAATPAPTPGQ